MDKYTQAHFAQSALITIDTQNDFTLEDAPFRIQGAAEVVPDMVLMLDKYRSKQVSISKALLVVFTKISYGSPRLECFQ